MVCCPCGKDPTLYGITAPQSNKLEGGISSYTNTRPLADVSCNARIRMRIEIFESTFENTKYCTCKYASFLPSRATPSITVLFLGQTGTVVTNANQ
jgi:hypothetical protein